MSAPSVVVSYCSCSNPVLMHPQCYAGANSLGKRKIGDDTGLTSTCTLQFQALSKEGRLSEVSNIGSIASVVDNNDTADTTKTTDQMDTRGSSEGPTLPSAEQTGYLQCAESHVEIRSFREQDSSAYFTKSFLDKNPTAIRTCALCEVQFGGDYKVSLKQQVYACQQAHKTHHACTYAICSPCYSGALAASHSLDDKSAGRISCRRNAGVNNKNRGNLN
jgi:hypothetical protein